jgi:hypothetical protein
MKVLVPHAMSLKLKRVSVAITLLRMFVALLNIRAEKFVINSLTVAFMIVKKYVIKVSVRRVLTIRVV